MESIQLFPTSKTTSNKKSIQKDKSKHTTKHKTKKVKKGPGLLFPKPLKKRKSVDLFSSDMLEPVRRNPNRYRRYTLRASTSPDLPYIYEGHNENSEITPEISSDKIILKKDVNILSPSLIKRKVKTNTELEKPKEKTKSPLGNIELFPSKTKQNKTIKSPTLSKLKENISNLFTKTKSNLSLKQNGGRKTKKELK